MVDIRSPDEDVRQEEVSLGHGALHSLVEGLLAQDLLQGGEQHPAHHRVLQIVYRVSSKTVPTWLFALLSASTHEKFRKFAEFATRILKIDLEIAEIIEVKVGKHHLSFRN